MDEVLPIAMPGMPKRKAMAARKTASRRRVGKKKDG
jgi:hypothetical protein